MKCPNCKERKNIEVNIHTDGYSSNIRECLSCGHIWYYSESKENIQTIKQGQELLLEEKESLGQGVYPV